MGQPSTQRTFVKGVDASTDKFDQNKGSVPRISNMVFTRRGSMITVDGSTPLSTPSNAFNPTMNRGAIVAIQQYLNGLSTIPGQPVPSGHPLLAGSGINVSAGGIPWGASGNVSSDVDTDTTTYAVASTSPVPSGTSLTDYLVPCNFNFNIPLGSTIVGVEVSFSRFFSGFGFFSGAMLGVNDDTISLYRNGALAGVNKSAAAAWVYDGGPDPTPENVSFGGPTDTWGLTLTPAQINANNSSFGFAIRASFFGPATDVNLWVNSARMTIFYTIGGSGLVQAQTGQILFYLQDSDPGVQLGEVSGLTATGVNVAGGTLTPGTTYQYGVLALDGQQNSSAGMATSIVLPGGMNAVQLTWSVVLGAGSYIIIGNTGTPSVTSPIITQVFQPNFAQNASGLVTPTTATYTDVGTTEDINNFPYGLIVWGTNNTIGPLLLYSLASINAANNQYNDPVLLAQFPSRGSDAAIPSNPPVSANGGLSGASGQVPQMIQFAGTVTIALGNGFPLQITDGTTVTPVTNTFTATYPQWAASTTFLVNDVVQPLTPNGFIFICIQGGQTGASEPGWNTGSGQTTTDNQALWQQNGQLTTSPAPPGAAHQINHAGSLWVFNTAPKNTADGLNGPSSLVMSDTNNANSWNPLNQAFIGKDDGSEGMGLASFTIAELGISPLGSLLVFKNFNTYQIVGVFGAQDFTIQEAQTDMGCLAPRSIKFLSGYGIVRMSHLGFAMYDGIRDRLVSEQIRPYIFGMPSTGSPGLTPITGIDLKHIYLIKSDLTISPPMYIAGAPLQGNVSLNRIFFYDLVLKAWTIIDLPAGVSPSGFAASIYQIRTPGIPPVTVIGTFDSGSIQIIQNGAALWSLLQSQIAVSWAVTTPEVFNSGDPSGEVYVSNLLIRGSNLDGNRITVTLNIQTEDGTIQDNRYYDIGTGEFQLMIGINEQAISFNAVISGTGRVELESFTWNAQGKSSGVPARIT